MSMFLLHSGVKGMKWGVRHLEKAKGIADNSKTITGEIRGHVEKSRSKKYGKDPKKMSDQELREKVARLNLEKQFSTLNAAEVSKGKKFALKALEVTGSIMTVAGSALTIAKLIQEISEE